MRSKKWLQQVKLLVVESGFSLVQLRYPPIRYLQETGLLKRFARKKLETRRSARLPAYGVHVFPQDTPSGNLEISYPAPSGSIRCNSPKGVVSSLTLTFALTKIRPRCRGMFYERSIPPDGVGTLGSGGAVPRGHSPACTQTGVAIRQNCGQFQNDAIGDIATLANPYQGRAAERT